MEVPPYLTDEMHRDREEFIEFLQNPAEALEFYDNKPPIQIEGDEDAS